MYNDNYTMMDKLQGIKKPSCNLIKQDKKCKQIWPGVCVSLTIIVLEWISKICIVIMEF